MENIPNDVAVMLDYKNWHKKSRLEKLNLLNWAIVEIFMADKMVLAKQERSRIAMLDRMRKREIINNWIKPKYDD